MIAISSVILLLTVAAAGVQGLPSASDLGMTCRQSDAVRVPLTALAHDAGSAGHVVAAAGDRNGAREVSSCRMPNPRSSRATARSCATRSIAWTWDDRIQAGLLQRRPKAPDLKAIWTIERASAWHYSSLAHLAVSTDPSRAELCRPQVPDPACSRDPVAFCRGLEGGGPDSDQACLAPAAMACQCDDLPGCRYPQVVDLAIDPGSGRVVAATDVGLLASQDGGRLWSRADVELRTAQGQDLHARPERIVAVTRLRTTWTPNGGRQRDHRPNGQWFVQADIRWHDGSTVRSAPFAGKVSGNSRLVLAEQGH